ncbi:MAG TPA: hypothetical protein VKY54_10200 [Kiloniellales bacterium]|nr:hypothetical protein [Kiloniellales bacterium]
MTDRAQGEGTRREAEIFLGFGVVSLLLFSLWFYSTWLQQEPSALAAPRQSEETAASNEIDDFIAQLEDLPVDFAPGETAHTLANLRFRQVMASWPPARGDLERLREEYVEALRQAPAKPYAWARLAYVEQGLGAPPERVIQLLRQSIYIGPAEPVLALWRLRLAAFLRPWWDDDFAALLPRQAAAAWNGPRRGLVELSLDHDLLDVIREGLRRDSEGFARFESLRERVHRIRERQRG